MKLVLIHGWGLSRSLWSPIIQSLRDHQCIPVDLGYFGTASEMPAPNSDCILVGHSFGFMHGVLASNKWGGLIAINGFARFADECVPTRVLDKMVKRLYSDPAGTVHDFHKLIACNHPPTGQPNTERLYEDLTRLLDTDISATLSAHAAQLLVLASANDPLVPKSVTKKLGGELHVHDHGGHLLPQTDPAWCADKIRTFLEQRAAA